MLAVVFVTVYTGVTLNTDLATGVFDRFRSLPVWRPAPIVGGLIGDAGRYLLACSLVIGLGLIMGFNAGGGPSGILAAVALVLVFAFALSWVWTTLGLVLRTPNAVMSIGFVILFPLTFVSNVFVDPDTMPVGAARIRRRQSDHLTWPPLSADSCRAPRPRRSCCGSSARPLRSRRCSRR